MVAHDYQILGWFCCSYTCENWLFHCLLFQTCAYSSNLKTVMGVLGNNKCTMIGKKD